MRSLKTLLSLAVLWPGLAFAQQSPSNDAYWQRLIAQKEAQSSLQIVELAKALDAANAKIADLQKQLDAQKAAKDKKP